MRQLGRRLPARLGLAALLAGAMVPLTAGAAQAADSAIGLSVHAGYQDVVKPGEWMPVVVDARNSGGGLDGTLEIQQSLPQQPGVPGLTIYQEPISLPSGATKHVRVYVSEDNTGATITARIIANGRVAASQDAVGFSTTSTLIGVLSDQAAALDEFAAVHPGGVAARVVHLHAEDLSDSAVPLRAFDVLVIDDFATDGLTAAQRSAITDYVSTGGTLLLGTGAAWRKTLGGLPAGILPMQPTGTLNVHDTRALGGNNVEVAYADSASGHAWLQEGGAPLILDRTVGAGTVTMATFDWNQDPVASWAGTKDLLRQLIARTVFARSSSTANIMYAGMAPVPIMGGFNGASQASVASKSGALVSVLGNLPGLDLPSLQLTGLLVLLYVLLVGPINYFVLGRMRRRALAWVTVPAIAIVASTGAYGAGVVTKGHSIQTNQVTLVHVEPGWDRAYQETYTGVIPPTRGDYQARIAGERLLITSIVNNYGGFGTTSTGATRVNVASNEVTLSGMTAFSLGGFASEAMTPAPLLSGHLQLVNGLITGTIENHSNLSFTDAVLLFGDSYQTFGALQPGASVTVSLTPKSTTTYGPPVYSQVYGTTYYQGPGAPTTAASRDNFAKTQVLSLLPVGTNFKGVSFVTAPVFVAWTHQSLQDVTVNGAHPRSTNLTAVALSLAVDRIGTGPLPAGVVNGRIVDLTGDSQGSGPPGMVSMQNGSATYEFTPTLADGAHLTGASINAQNPYGPKFGLPGVNGQTGPSVSGKVWDWTQSAWVDIVYQNNGTSAVPDSAINPTTGAIRLRLTATNGGLIGGNLSLSGTVS